jgi:hypothetical protein
MEMIDRYLQAIGFWLPPKQKGDILAEFSVDIHTEMEEEAALLGRALSEAEIEILLKRRGSPIVVASRYLPQQFLIGPLLMPVYRLVLKIAAFCYLLPGFAIGWCLALLSPGFRLEHYGPVGSVTYQTLVRWLMTNAFVVFGCVTLAFMAIERIQARSNFLDKWDPCKLPPVRNLRKISRTSSAIELAVNLIILLWWAGNAGSDELPLGPTVHITFASQWSWVYWSYLILAVVATGTASVNLLLPYWTTARVSMRIATTGIGAIIFCVFTRAHLLTGFAIGATDARQQQALADAINHAMSTNFPFAVLAGMIVVGVETYRLIGVRGAMRASECAPVQ